MNASAAADNPAPRHYALQKTLGAGAMGEIWLAQDLGLKRRVAYKRMHAHIAQDPSALARFLREMQITAQLDHPHIVPVYECELNPDGSLAYAMKLVKGQTLKDLLQAKKSLLDQGLVPGPQYSLETLIDYFLSVCDAMSYAHSKGVIHRDLKPVNLMIGEYGEVYVMDWGIARRMGRHDADEPAQDQIEAEINVDETRVGQILGTPRYMSPQQAAGKNQELDGRSDQFSLGLILFEMLTLRPAFSAPNAIELLKKVLKVELQPFEAYHAQTPIPRELKAITLKALARKPGERYASLAEMAADIRRWQQGQAVLAQPDSPLQQLVRWLSQHRQLALAICFGILLLFLASVSFSLYRQQQAQERERVQTAAMNQLTSLVSQQGQRLDSHFLTMQSLLAYLASAAIQSLEADDRSHPGPYYSNHPFQAPDQIESPLFGGRISLDWPIVGFSPSRPQAQAAAALQPLLPLRQILKEVVLRSATPHPEQLSPAEIEQLIAVKGTPIMWSHVTLKQGVIYFYPGKDYYTPGYDPITRPFYTNVLNKQGPLWGAPYYDPLSGVLLPCSKGLYDKNGGFLGAAVIDLRFQYVVDHLLKLQHSGFQRSFLLNEKGQIIVRSDQSSQAKLQDLTQSFQTPAYPDDGLQTAIRSQKTGGYLVSSKGLILFSRLNTLGWYFVVESQAP